MKLIKSVMVGWGKTEVCGQTLYCVQSYATTFKCIYIENNDETN